MEISNGDFNGDLEMFNEDDQWTVSMEICNAELEWECSIEMFNEDVKSRFSMGK